MNSDLHVSPRLFASSGSSFASYSGMFAGCTSAASVRTSARLCTLVSVVTVGLGSELRVRVRLSDGSVTEQVSEADSERDSISSEFKQGDGTLITLVADFKQEVKIFRASILGELERGQNQYQASCFISRLNRNEIIPSESMARLRQKNPHVIRSAEERKGSEQSTMSAAVNLSRAWQLSSHIHNMCSEAHEAIYTREADVKYWSEKGVDGSIFEISPQTTEAPSFQACHSTKDLWQPCLCTYGSRSEWYPCVSKYCRSRDGTAKGSTYKCGIRSCSKGYHFTYYVPQKQLCLWDEET